MDVRHEGECDLAPGEDPEEELSGCDLCWDEWIPVCGVSGRGATISMLKPHIQAHPVMSTGQNMLACPVIATLLALAAVFKQTPLHHVQVDGQTYDNECKATCQGIEVAHEDVCKK